MRGGVSLAVWIGGSCAELDTLRGADLSAQAPLYGRLLEIAGYSDVVVDLISGASAGGLNGVLFAMSLAYGVPFAETRDTWMRLADIHRMTHRPGQRPAPLSLLKGDDYFLPELTAELERLMGGAVEGGRAYVGVPSLDLYLSATLLVPSAQSLTQDAGPAIEELRHGAMFHFSHYGAGRPEGTDLGGPVGATPESISAAALRLATAARASSSFPVAFEPALVSVSRPSQVDVRPGPGVPQDMFGVFSEPGPPGHGDYRDYQVVDGGVLDNIPVSRAIRALAAATVPVPADRWLLFLHPSPDAGAERVLSNRRANAAEVVQATAGARMNQESLLDDISVLKEHNQRRARDAAAYDAVMESVNAGPGTPRQRLVELAPTAFTAYRNHRGKTDAARLIGLMSDAREQFEFDPYPSHGPATALQEWPPRERALLRRRLSGMLVDELPESAAEEGWVRGLGIAPLVRSVRMLLTWARALERSRTNDQGPGAGQLDLWALQRGLLEVLAASTMLARLELLTWPQIAADIGRPDPGDGDWFDAWSNARSRAHNAVYLHATDGVAAALLADLRPERYTDLQPDDASQAMPAELRQQFAEAARRSLAAATAELQRERLRVLKAEVTDRLSGAAVPPAASLRIDAALWDVVPAYASRLAEASAGWAGSGSPLVEFLRSLSAEEASRLATWGGLEVVTFPVTAGGEADRTAIRFQRVAGTNPTPLADAFPPGIEEVRNKLAGNDLANFAAFYRRSWRANDWMWGRMDAATSVVDLLVDPDRLRARFGDGRATEDAVAELLGIIEAAVTSVPDVRDPALTPQQVVAWGKHFVELWELRRGAVAGELKALFDAGDGVPPDLDDTRAAITAYRHWLILLDELPAVVAAAEEEEKLGRHRRPRDQEDLARTVARLRSEGEDPLRDPGAMTGLLKEYRVGRETISMDAKHEALNSLLLRLAAVGKTAFIAEGPEIRAPGPARPPKQPTIQRVLKGPAIRGLTWIVQRAATVLASHVAWALLLLAAVVALVLFSGYAAVGPLFRSSGLRAFAVVVCLVALLLFAVCQLLVRTLRPGGGLIALAALVALAGGLVFAGTLVDDDLAWPITAGSALLILLLLVLVPRWWRRWRAEPPDVSGGAAGVSNARSDARLGTGPSSG